jgi:hypothetical protein
MPAGIECDACAGMHGSTTGDRSRRARCRRMPTCAPATVPPIAQRFFLF